MPLDNYGVLKGRPVQRRLARVANAHYQVHVVDKDTDYRIAVNVRSKLSPSELEYLVDEDFQHPITRDLLEGAGQSCGTFVLRPQQVVCYG